MSNQTIAIIGASSNRKKYGNMAVRAWRDRGYTVYPVNPHSKEIEGMICYKDIRDIPVAVDTASIYLPPHHTLEVLDAIAEKGISMIYLNPGSENTEVLQKVEELGLNAVQACSIIAAGHSPLEYD